MRIGSVMIVAWVVLGVACSDVNSGTQAGDSAETAEVAGETSEVAAETVAEVTPEVEAEVEAVVEVVDEVADVVAEVDAAEVVEVPPCGCDYGQRCDTACEVEGTVCVRDDENDSRTCGPPAQRGEVCGNYDRAYHRSCEPGLTCSFPLPDDADSYMLCYDCRPQDFVIIGNCEAEIGVFWDGADCALYSGCSCEGAACATPFESVAQCRSKTQTPCGGEQ